jgi:hypothetical protein
MNGMDAMVKQASEPNYLGTSERLFALQHRWCRGLSTSAKVF